jgi:autotransporter-associated beta strand protein
VTVQFGNVTNTVSSVTMGGGMLALTADLSMINLVSVSNMVGAAGIITNSGSGPVTLSIRPNSAITYSGAIQDGAGALQILNLTKTTASTFILAGENTYTGFTTVYAGTLQIGNGFNTGSIVSPTISLLAGANLAWNRTGSSTYSGIIIGAGGMSVAGGYSLVLTGSNSFTGATTITGTGSTIRLGTGTAQSGTMGNVASILINNGSTFEVTTGGQINTVLGSTITVSDGGRMLFSGTAGSGAITVSASTVNGPSYFAGNGVSTGTLTMQAGGNNYLYVTDNPGAIIPGSVEASPVSSTLTLGGLILNQQSSLFLDLFAGASDSVSMTGFSGDIIKVNGAAPILNGAADSILLNLNGVSGFGSGYYNLFTGYSGQITNSLALNLQAPSGYIIDGIFNDTGRFYIHLFAPTTRTWEGGTDNIWNFTTSNFAGGNVFTDGESVTFDNTTSTNYVVVSGTVSPANMLINNDLAHTYTFVGGNIVASGSLTKTGDGAVVFANNNNFISGLVISAGSVVLGTGGTIGGISDTTPISMASGANLIVNRSDTVTLTAAISGGGGLTFAGTGTLQLGSSANSYSGGTTINGGGQVIALGAGIVSNNGTWNILNGALTLTSSTVMSNDGIVIGTSGTLNIRSALVTPTTSVTGGVLNVVTSTLSTTGLLINGGTVNVTGSSITTTNVTFSGNGGVINLTGGGMTVTTAGITINGDVGSSTLINIATGRTLTLNGSLTFSNANGNQNGAVISGAGTVNLVAARTINVADSTSAIDDLTISSNIVAAASAFTKTGLGTLYLAGTNASTAINTLSAGTLAIGNNTALGTNVLTVLGGAIRADSTARTLANNISLSASATIGGTSNITFNGTVSNLANSTLTISNTTGLVTIATLQLNTGTTNRTLTISGAGNLTVNLLTNVGSTFGNLTVNGAGLSLTLLGNNSTFTGATNIQNGIVYAGNSGAFGVTTSNISLGTNTTSDAAVITVANIDINRSFLVTAGTGARSFGGATAVTSTFAVAAVDVGKWWHGLVHRQYSQWYLDSRSGNHQDRPRNSSARRDRQHL